jgi:hypothetical protein
MHIPFKYKLSDLVRMDILDIGGVKVLELEFRFARYQLILDDEEKTKQLVELFTGKIVWPDKGEKEKKEVQLPRFYSKGGK